MRIPGRGRSEKVFSSKQKAARAGVFPTGGSWMIWDQPGEPPYAGLSAAWPRSLEYWVRDRRQNNGLSTRWIFCIVPNTGVSLDLVVVVLRGQY
jgi:hypothetical protein